MNLQHQKATKWGSKNQGPQCYECQEFGHKRAECPNKKQSWNTGKNKGFKKDFHKSKDGKSSSTNDRSLLVTVNALKGYSEDERNSWYADKGATRHVTHQADIFNSFVEFPKGDRRVFTADGTVLEATGKGTVTAKVSINGKWKVRQLVDVWLVPKMKMNLFSVTATQDRRLGREFVSNAKSCKLIDDDGIQETGWGNWWLVQVGHAGDKTIKINCKFGSCEQN